MDKVNKQELRRLAEAQPIKVWRRDDGRLPFKPSVERMFFVEGPDVVSDYEEVGFSRSAASFIAAANPAAILSLLDELEQYRKDALRYRWLCDQPGFQLWLDGVLRDEEINSTGLDVDIDIDALMAKEGGANG